MNGNIEVTDTGEFVSISKGDNLKARPRVWSNNDQGWE